MCSAQGVTSTVIASSTFGGCSTDLDWWSCWLTGWERRGYWVRPGHAAYWGHWRTGPGSPDQDILPDNQARSDLQQRRNFITVTSWHLKSLTTLQFVQQLVQDNNQNTKAMHHWHFVRENPLVTGRFPSQRTNNVNSMPQPHNLMLNWLIGQIACIWINVTEMKLQCVYNAMEFHLF